jgi:hypothetical protein
VLERPEAGFFHEEVREASGVLAEHLEEVADHEVRAEVGEAEVLKSLAPSTHAST